MDFLTAFKKAKQERTKGRYRTGKYSCLAGLILVAFYAISMIPPLYEDGLTANDWVMIVLILLSGIVLLYLERGYSSKSNTRPHDYKSSGGSMHAFSFDRRLCRKCGSRLVLATKTNGKTVYVAPGATSEGDVFFCCPKCGAAFAETDCPKETFEPSKMTLADYSKVNVKTKGLKAYKISTKYLKMHFLTAGITIAGSLYTFYLARLGPLKLILPFAVSYFTFVNIYNLLRYLSTRYYVTEDGIIEKSLWQIALYAFDDTVCVIRYGNEKGLRSRGIITSKENLLISAIIDGSEQMIDEIHAVCEKRNIPEIG